MALTIKIIAPDRVAFEGEARSIVLPAWKGEMEVLPGHSQYAALLNEGMLTLTLGSGTQALRTVGTGLVEIAKDQVTVFADHVT